MQMRIVIEIDQDEVTATTVDRPAEAAMAPPELSRRAAELGATSAGPAPTGPGAAGRLEELPAAALAALTETSIDAGAAPTEPGEATVRQKEQEPTETARRSSPRARSTKGRSGKD
jgi:hypothetical protein